MRLQLLMQLSKRAENDILKSKEFTLVQFKKSQHVFVNI